MKLLNDRIINEFSYLKDNGPRRTFHYFILRASEKLNEHYHNIVTSGRCDLDTFGIENADYKSYAPIDYGSFKSVMRCLKIDPGRDVFLDYGAGKGRAVVLAATYPFKRVIGVEFISSFANIARENTKKATTKIRCGQIEIVTADATQYVLHDDINFIHLFNPFTGQILSKVMNNIMESLTRSPRVLTLLYGYPFYFEMLRLEESRCLPDNWIRSHQDVPFPHWRRSHPDKNKYRIYRIYPN
jgi:hypothetical protein